MFVADSYNVFKCNVVKCIVLKYFAVNITAVENLYQKNYSKVKLLNILENWSKFCVVQYSMIVFTLTKYKDFKYISVKCTVEVKCIGKKFTKLKNTAVKYVMVMLDPF